MDTSSGMRLFEISRDGSVSDTLVLDETAREVCRFTADMYTTQPFVKPWIAYLTCTEDDLVIGTCAFKSPPRNNKTEIAYFTFPGFEGRGYATFMADALIEIALKEIPSLIITAQTLPERNASGSILEKLGFERCGEIMHPEDGLVWEWQLNAPAEE